MWLQMTHNDDRYCDHDAIADDDGCVRYENECCADACRERHVVGAGAAAVSDGRSDARRADARWVVATNCSPTGDRHNLAWDWVTFFWVSGPFLAW